MESNNVFQYHYRGNFTEIINILKIINDDKDNFTYPLWEVNLEIKYKDNLFEEERIIFKGYLYQKPSRKEFEKISTGAFGELSLRKVSDVESILTMICYEPIKNWAFSYFLNFEKWIKKEKFPKLESIDYFREKRRKGPTDETSSLFIYLKKLKDANPSWTQSKLAMEAREDLGEKITEFTVKNTYRAMGEKWKKGKNSY